MPNYDYPVVAAERELATARATLRADPDNPFLRPPVEHAEQRLRNAEAQRDFSMKIDAERAAAAAQREEAARHALEERLMQDYMAAAPGTTEEDARSALPDLLHQHRLAEMGQRERDVAKARANPRYSL